MKALALLVVTVGIAAGFAACFHDEGFKNYTIKCSTDDMRECPSGSYCLDNFCFHPDLYGVDLSAVDGFITADGGTDAADDL